LGDAVGRKTERVTGGRNGVEASFFEKKWTAAIRAGRQPQTTGHATARSAPCALVGFSASITIATIMSDTHSYLAKAYAELRQLDDACPLLIKEEMIWFITMRPMPERWYGLLRERMQVEE
jgi:hypothetical protein